MHSARDSGLWHAAMHGQPQSCNADLPKISKLFLQTSGCNRARSQCLQQGTVALPTLPTKLPPAACTACPPASPLLVPHQQLSIQDALCWGTTCWRSTVSNRLQGGQEVKMTGKWADGLAKGLLPPARVQQGNATNHCMRPCTLALPFPAAAPRTKSRRAGRACLRSSAGHGRCRCATSTGTAGPGPKCAPGQ